ncbi:exo-alpha-sialidase [soil metagenome]
MKGSFLLTGAFIFCIHMSYSQKKDLTDKLQLVDSGFIFSDAPFLSCHASSVCMLPDEEIIAAWFAGKAEGDPDVSIWMSKMRNGEWSEPKEIANGLQQDGSQFACWNPVLFRSNEGILFLFYKVGPSPQTWWGEVKTSENDGTTWSDARRLPEGFLGPIKNKPIQLRNGDILYPSSTESENDNTWEIHLERSDGKGNNWRKIYINCDTFDVIQPTLLTYPNGSMQLLCRSRENLIAQSWSFDGGETWEKVTATSLPNPNSGIDGVSLENDLQLLVYNPLLAKQNWWEGRSVLKVAVSADGQLWKDVFTLENHPAGEYSYPAVIQSPDGIIHITYTFERRKIKHVSLR